MRARAEHTRSDGRRRALAGGLLASGIGVVGVLGATSLAVGAARVPHASSQTVITVEHSKTWGSILELSNGDTVYRLTADSKNKSVCSGSCAAVWPPVLLASGQHSPVGKGVSKLGTIKRANGSEQVTYEGVPLYRYVGDKKAGAITGNLKDKWGQWWVVNPAHPTATPTKSSSSGIPAGGTGTGIAY